MLRTRPHLHIVARHQYEVAVLIAEGLTDGEIDRQLGVTAGTAATYAEVASRRLSASTRAQAARWAVAHGIV